MRAPEFVAFLVSRGLSAAASSESTAELHGRYGERNWYGFGTVIDLPAASLFAEQTEPFYVHLEPRRYLLPPEQFTCDFDRFREGARNHQVALERLRAMFGKPQAGMASNTREHSWHFGDLSLSIRTFLREKSQFGRNDLYDNNPGLWEVCAITISRPWVGELTAEEEARIAGVPPRDLFLLPAVGAQPQGGGYTRRHKLLPLPSAYLWRTATQIGWCHGNLAAVFERSDVEKLALLQILPARGGGGAEVCLRVRNPYSLEREMTSRSFLESGQTHGLDDMAARVARFWGVSLTVSETHDC